MDVTNRIVAALNNIEGEVCQRICSLYVSKVSTMSGNGSDYERFIDPIEDQMVRLVWRIVRHRQDFEDALQEALTTIWKRLDRIRRHRNPHALILRICANAGYDILRAFLDRRNYYPGVDLFGHRDQSHVTTTFSDQLLCLAKG